MAKKKKVIIIVGPTASGKTAFSLEMAAHFNTAIISADSRQCFKELNIGVAKPSDSALNSIKHYFINSHSIHDKVNAAVFEQYALAAVEERFKLHDMAIVVGGTGMYIKAFCEGLDEIPEVDTLIRQQIMQQYEQKGLLWLQEEIQLKDPLFWEHAEQKNPQRLMRALEVVTSTGKSITQFQINKSLERSFDIIKTGIDLPKQQLHEQINHRVDEMITAGLVDEVEALAAYKTLNALQTVGYKEIFDYLDGKCTLTESVEKIKINTRQYAKRQLTWFKKDKDILWNPTSSIVKRLRDIKR